MYFTHFSNQPTKWSFANDNVTFWNSLKIQFSAPKTMKTLVFNVQKMKYFRDLKKKLFAHTNNLTANRIQKGGSRKKYQPPLQSNRKWIDERMAKNPRRKYYSTQLLVISTKLELSIPICENTHDDIGDFKGSEIQMQTCPRNGRWNELKQTAIPTIQE